MKKIGREAKKEEKKKWTKNAIKKEFPHFA